MYWLCSSPKFVCFILSLCVVFCFFFFWFEFTFVSKNRDTPKTKKKIQSEKFMISKFRFYRSIKFRITVIAAHLHWNDMGVQESKHQKVPMKMINIVFYHFVYVCVLSLMVCAVFSSWMGEGVKLDYVVMNTCIFSILFRVSFFFFWFCCHS